ncbi:hypothetical protein Q8G16_26455, partial [Klebsiella pneumoniae]|uniref:hypothetical protein n=1 Tax=Klebsiella pneumoniae TaxID=573 RepID=UPI0027318C84
REVYASIDNIRGVFTQFCRIENPNMISVGEWWVVTIIYALVNPKKSPVGIGGYVRRNNFAGVLVCIT